MKRLFAVIVALLALFSFAMTQTAPAQAQADGASWKAEFFDNAYFLGDPVFTEVRNAVNFNFGTNAPRNGFPNTNYTIRIASDIFFPVGNYRFYLLSDDGATVTFDFNQRIVSSFDEPQPGQTLSGDLSVTRAGVYHIQIDYRQREGAAYIYFDFESTDDGIRGPRFPIGVTPSPVDPGANLQPVGDLFWTGQYYNNRDLSGFPVAVTSNIGLRFDWGAGAPLPNVPADNFSARWNSVYNFSGGDYLIQVRSDDGVRVYLDGVMVINEWRDATGETYRAVIRPAAGNRTLTVEYYEAFGVAFIDFQLFRVIPTTTQPTPPQPSSPYGAFATVIAGRLNVRDLPDASAGRIIDRINRGETYPIIGKRADNRWVQVTVRGQTGWVNALYVSAVNLNNVPVTHGELSQPPAQPQPTGFTAFTRTEVNLRTGPDTSFDRILILPQNITVEIIGRNTRATWWQVRYDGTTGWVSANFAVIQQENPDLNRIPISG